jgi:hypothetical protein
MKHCHFTILCNELPFLKQKMEFLYKNFDQLIFYDLCIACKPMKHSWDGTWEYLRRYPDPEEKITIIDKLDLRDVEGGNGASLVEKQKMFRYGSTLVNDDIDVFWCTDMDEFFNKSLINKVEEILLEDEEVSSIRVNWMNFWREIDIVLDRPNGWLANRGRKPLTGLFCPPRIARHKPGNVYPHCRIQELGEVFQMDGSDELLYHFAWIGDSRVKAKRLHQPIDPEEFDRWYDEVWKGFETSDVAANYSGYIPGLNVVVPNPQTNPLGLRRFSPDIPEYIDMDILIDDLNMAK